MVQAAPAPPGHSSRGNLKSQSREGRHRCSVVSACPQWPEKTPATRNQIAADAASTGSASRAQIGDEKEATNASGAEIRSAKVGGKVWVNTDSGVYHKSGRWYGATKEGKFMTEQEAMRAGYKPAKNEK
jgi:hypothetical protein